MSCPSQWQPNQQDELLVRFSITRSLTYLDYDVLILHEKWDSARLHRCHGIESHSCQGVKSANSVYKKTSINNSTLWIGLTGSLHFVTERRLQGTPCASCVGQMGHRSCCGRSQAAEKIIEIAERNSKSSKSHDIRCQATSFLPLAVSLLYIVFLKQIKYGLHKKGVIAFGGLILCLAMRVRGQVEHDTFSISGQGHWFLFRLQGNVFVYVRVFHASCKMRLEYLRNRHWTCMLFHHQFSLLVHHALCFVYYVFHCLSLC